MSKQIIAATRRQLLALSRMPHGAERRGTLEFFVRSNNGSGRPAWLPDEDAATEVRAPGGSRFVWDSERERWGWNP